MVTAYLIMVAQVTYAANYVHYTWINIGCWGVYALAATFGLDELLYWAFMSMQSQVILGVILMSYAECKVFTQTFSSVGPVVYIIGNFFMHYLPFVQSTALVDKKKLSYNPTFISSSIWSGYGVLAAWDYWFDPWQVYGCTRLSKHVATFAPCLLAFVETVVLPLVFSHHYISSAR